MYRQSLAVTNLNHQKYCPLGTAAALGLRRPASPIHCTPSRPATQGEAAALASKQSAQEVLMVRVAGENRALAEPLAKVSPHPAGAALQAAAALVSVCVAWGNGGGHGLAPIHRDRSDSCCCLGPRLQAVAEAEGARREAEGARADRQALRATRAALAGAERRARAAGWEADVLREVVAQQAQQA